MTTFPPDVATELLREAKKCITSGEWGGRGQHEVVTSMGTIFISATREYFGAPMVLTCVFIDREASLKQHSTVEAIGLTPTQMSVARLIARRLKNGEIAEELGISPHTVRRHTEAIFQRLDVTSRTEVERALLSRLSEALTKQVANPV